MLKHHHEWMKERGFYEAFSTAAVAAQLRLSVAETKTEEGVSVFAEAVLNVGFTHCLKSLQREKTR